MILALGMDYMRLIPVSATYKFHWNNQFSGLFYQPEYFKIINNGVNTHKNDLDFPPIFF